MKNKPLFQNYGLKALQIIIFAFAILIIQSTANAQTALEQQCFDAVQGKVAWNQAGNTSWSETNIRNLCRGTTNPGATITCFQAQIKQHNDWSRAINACLPGSSAISLPNKIQEEKVAAPAALENVRTVTFKNNASIQATLGIGSASSGQLNIGESKTVNIKEAPGTPLQVEVTMRLTNPDYFVIYRGTISGDNRATNFCFEAKGDVMKPTASPCNGTQATEARKIEFTNQAGFIARPTLSYFVGGSPRSITTDDTSLGINRSIYIPTDADRDKDIILSATYFSLQGKHEFDKIRIDRNSNFSPCYKFWGDTMRPKMGLCSTDTSSRRIRLRNNAGFNARMKVIYYDKGQSGNDVGTTVRTNIIEVLQSDTIVIPQGTSDKPVEVIIDQDEGNSQKKFFTTNVSANFKGELCFKTEGTSFNPTASNCDDTVGDTSGDIRQIKFQNDGAYDAQATVMYFEYQNIGGTRVSMPKTISTGFINLGKNRMITVPKEVVPGTVITIMLQGNATVKNDIWSTTLPADFKGSPVPCFKVWGSLFNPSGGKCNN